MFTFVLLSKKHPYSVYLSNSFCKVGPSEHDIKCMYVAKNKVSISCTAGDAKHGSTLRCWVWERLWSRWYVRQCSLQCKLLLSLTNRHSLHLCSTPYYIRVFLHTHNTHTNTLASVCCRLKNDYMYIFNFLLSGSSDSDAVDMPLDLFCAACNKLFKTAKA